MSEHSLVQFFADAGLSYQGMVDTSATLIPPIVATAVRGCSIADGLQWESVDRDDRMLVAKSNAAWHLLSRQVGLFSGSSDEFLVAVDLRRVSGEDLFWWARVQLGSSWDITGSSASLNLLGYPPGYPQFVMLSGDGDTIVLGDTGQTAVQFLALSNPRDVGHIRRYAEADMESQKTDEFTKNAIRRWLAG